MPGYVQRATTNEGGRYERGKRGKRGHEEAEPRRIHCELPLIDQGRRKRDFSRCGKGGKNLGGPCGVRMMEQKQAVPVAALNRKESPRRQEGKGKKRHKAEGWRGRLG